MTELESQNRTGETKTCEILYNATTASYIYVDGKLGWYCEDPIEIMEQIESCFENDFFDSTTKILLKGDLPKKSDYILDVTGMSEILLSDIDLFNAQLYAWLNYGRHGVSFQLYKKY